MCVDGDPIASCEHLRTAIGGKAEIQRVGTDRYGRTLALVQSLYNDLTATSAGAIAPQTAAAA